MSAVLELTQALINRASVTPDDGGCQALIAERLSALVFTHHALARGEVSNQLSLSPNDGPLLLFLGHTDVVPPGPEAAWQSPPFHATERGGYLYGRGAADMKSSLAAFVCACEQLDAIEHLEGRIERYDEFIPELRAWGQSPVYAMAWRNLYAEVIAQLYAHEWLGPSIDKERNYRLVEDGIRFGKR